MTSSGVGHELGLLIPKWVAQSSSKCKCSDMATKMDRYGVNWCEDNKDTIVAHLMSQSDHLIPIFKIVPPKMKKRVAMRLVDKAIENAKRAT